MSAPVYDLLLRVWPAEFRRRHGGAMRRDYLDALADARRLGRLRLLGTRAVWWADTVRHGFGERLAARGPRAPRPGRPFWPRSLGFDVRHALRRLVREPGFALFVALTLALGIGGTAAMFAFYNAAFLRPLPWPEGDRLQGLEMVDGQGRSRARLSMPDVMDLAAVPGVVGVAWLDQGDVAIAGGSGEAEVARGAHASPSVFEVLRTTPARGRLFRPEEGVPGRADVAVLSDGLWRRRFGADPSAVGQTLEVQGRPHVIVGVLPPGFRAPIAGEEGDPEIWLPLALEGPLAERGARWLQGIVRLGEGVATGTAATGMAAVAERLAAAHPATNAGLSIRPVPLREAIWGDARTPMRLILAATTFVLLIACANLANLLLARNAGRASEMALRAALGAGRLRTAQQLIVEHGVLALLGGLAGGALMVAVLGATRRLAAGRLPALTEAPVDVRVVGFLFGLSLLAGLLFGVLPALRSRAGTADLLREGRGSTGGRTARALRRLLVGAQVALCFVLLAGAVLLLRGFRTAVAVDPGFDTERILAWEVSLPATRYADGAAVIAYKDAVLRRLEALPGVESAAIVDRLPLGSRYGCGELEVEGAPAPADPGTAPCADGRAVTPDYLRTMGIDLLDGRPMSLAEPGGVLINRTLAGMLWPGESPLGRRLAWSGARAQGADWWQVIGVVEDVLHLGPQERPLPEIYHSFDAAPDRRASFVVRAAGDPDGLLAAVRAAAAEVDPNVPLRGLRPMRAALLEKLAAPRTGLLILAALSVIALFLAVVGLYGVQSYVVARRSSEIGIRMALGADRRSVVRLIVREGMTTVLLATLLGAALAVGGAHAIRAFLFGADPADPVTFLAVAAVLLTVSALACWAPARRAASIGPTGAMRHE